MTTIVVVKKGDEVAIAADCQSTFGDTRLSAVHDARYNKIFQLDDSYIAIAGSAAHDLVLQSALARLKHRDLSSRPAIFETFRKLHPKLKDDFFLKTEEEEDDPYESSQMTVLIANPHGIFAIYSMREVYEYNRYWAIGSGRDFAIGAMYAGFDSASGAADLAQLGVRAGCEFDVGSALPMTLYTARLSTGTDTETETIPT
ncbi:MULTISPECIES: MFS transporter [Microvirgula]|uniref:MFS transporter n=1 Tax=Microvirgula aerodenitrificans TaxID=57480 RepID=A0A2S0PBS6_9NEIS|nr:MULTISPECIES: MFS transporter [Microvirgula]AVY94727.1 MFS transporter [Microvirgula aerodenitrificans]RAS17098.1 ATP-dependent protease HslVU (ClpYQ) peptidase subunit [Microvirgula sp. AG722]